MMTVSTLPPAYPERSPIAPPTKKVASAESTAIIIEIRPPYASRVRMSRPLPSLPRMYPSVIGGFSLSARWFS
jgi:hypothetical protein